MKLIEAHSDERRSIHVVQDLLPENKEFSIINLKKGKAIGGCMHNNTEYMCLVSGCIVARFGNKEAVMFPGESHIIDATTPHMFVAEQDSIILEWGITEAEKKCNLKDEEMLKLVEGLNGKSIN